MPLTRVTITGADDSTHVVQLLELSQEFPWVEWGILVSKSQEGHYRFPSRTWIDTFCDVAEAYSLQVSTHICGRWVRDIFAGKFPASELPKVFAVSDRCQLNTHAQPHDADPNWFRGLAAYGQEKEFIFQLDGVNDGLAQAAQWLGVNASGLFDSSHGAGSLPHSWPEPYSGLKCGYAGGLGPSNVAEEIRKIMEVCQELFWIDMESRVRLPNDSSLDMASVRAVLEACAPLVVKP